MRVAVMLALLAAGPASARPQAGSARASAGPADDGPRPPTVPGPVPALTVTPTPGAAGGPGSRGTAAPPRGGAAGARPQSDAWPIARLEIERAEALVKEARSGYYPLLNLNATYTRLDHDWRISGSGAVVASGNQLTANVTLTAPIISAPAWANASHAESTRRIADASAADVRRQVAQATARAFLTVVAQHRLVQAVETARASAKEHYDYAHARLVGGIGRAIDEVRAAQDLAAVDRQVQSTYLGLAAAREALGVLVASGAAVDAAEDVDLGPAPTLADALAEARAGADRRQGAEPAGGLGGEGP